MRWLICSILLFSCNLAAQNTEAALAQRAETAIAEMSKLEFLVGDWKGSGSAFMQNKDFPATMTQSVEKRLGGKLLLLETHDSMSWLPAKVQGGLTTISFDAENNRYHVRAYFGDGRFVDTSGKVEGQTFIWGYGQFRTIIKVDGKKWVSVSAVQVGDSWRKVQESTLERVN